MEFEFIFMCSADINCAAQLLEINYFQNLFTVVTSAEATTLNEKIDKLTIAKEKNIEFIFFRTLICITQVLLRTIRDNLTAS